MAFEREKSKVPLLGLISIFDKERKTLKESAKCIVGEGECTNLKNPFKKSTEASVHKGVRIWKED
jgi:hypothetical protein